MTKKPRTKKQFKEHFEGLVAYYAPKLDDVDMPDTILSGMSRTDPIELTFDQLFALNSGCIYALNQMTDLPPIVMADKISAFVEWLKPQQIELQILALRTVVPNKKVWAHIQKSHKDFLEPLKAIIDKS